jgi:hypothetical protein
MEDLLQYLTSKARDLGAQYTDSRFQDVRQTLITAENGSLRSFESDRSFGVGVRVLVDGAWGIASSTVLERKVLRQKVSEAVRMAKAARKLIASTRLAKVKPVEATFELPVKIDPDNIPLDVKVKALLEANKSGHSGADIKNSFSRGKSGIAKIRMPLISAIASKVPLLTVNVDRTSLRSASRGGRAVMFASGAATSMVLPFFAAAASFGRLPMSLTVFLIILSAANLAFDLYYSPKAGDISRIRTLD